MKTSFIPVVETIHAASESASNDVIAPSVTVIAKLLVLSSVVLTGEKSVSVSDLVARKRR